MKGGSMTIRGATSVDMTAFREVSLLTAWEFAASC
jgi:hypothetical protein